ncbi:MAG: tRNA (guanosine(37)-N1)-methyltransferase TrmD [Spirochaetaceae bacterium]|jgi:tRNA (guanine37-N1)-methyltransferase|nr:tRNA (guanosine(37)-N1)-methyltransferase TrmD [Spirochaetaceae bacterium]
MKFTVLTLFPEITDAYFASSIMARALDRGIISYQAVNIRDFATDKHKTCDDAPYGGGPGMLMLAEPLSRALKMVSDTRRANLNIPQELTQGNKDTKDIKPRNNSRIFKILSFFLCGLRVFVRGIGTMVPDTFFGGSGGPQGRSEGGPDGASNSFGRMTGNRPPHIIYLTPSGRPFTQRRAEELAAMEELVLVCGRYEGIDQRVIDAYVDEELSVGDYVLSSGEVAALAVIDTVYRLVDRVITPESLEEESFSGGLLEYPQYTRPETFDTMKVPEVLLSGHHENIRRWRLKKRIEKTRAFRPELLEQGLQMGLFDAETVKLIEESKG